MQRIQFDNDGPCGQECTGDCDGCPNVAFLATEDASWLAGVGVEYEDEIEWVE